MDLVLTADRIITADGECSGWVAIADGRIAALGDAESGAPPPSRERIDLRADEVLLPGLVDTHVHVNEPGRTEWEGFASATAAAAAGGVTTLIDMPLNSIPPTVTAEALAVKRSAAAGQCHVDVGFWGGAVPGHEPDLAPLHADGVFGFKCFLLHSGVDEFAPLSPEELPVHLARLAGLGALMVVHAEDADVIDAAPEPQGASYAAFVESRPPQAETRAIETVLRAARETGARVHILHLSAASALPILAAARAEGLPVTVETCPHYLSFAAEEIADGATAYKCCPPIRDDANRDALWQGLVDGVIDIVVSDHSPSVLSLKCLDTGDLGAAWGGIASVQLGLSAIWTGARERGIPLARVVGWMATGPADLVGLGHKGRLEVGADADLVVFAPEETQRVDAAALRHRNPITPYDGQTLHGVVRSTFLRGVPVLGDAPRGRLLSRTSNE
ncbi:MAG: allantoinase AllB [Nocardioides sp.]